MHKIGIGIFLAAIFSSHSLFANERPVLSSSHKPCTVIANSCLKAGFVRGKTVNKKIWKDCMKPIILGKSIANVTVDPTIIKSCRIQKIDQLKRELHEFQQAALT